MKPTHLIAISQKLNSLVLIVLLIALLLLSVTSLTLGAIPLHLSQVFAYFTNHSTKLTQIILSTIRVPRTITAIAAGAALGVSGLLLQTTTKNNLACPTILGINQGASLVALALLLWLPAINSMLYFLLVTLGGLSAFFLTLIFSASKQISTSKLVLIGTSFNALFYGVTYLLIIVFPVRAQNLLFVLHGTLAGTKPFQSYALLIIATACIGAAYFFRHRLSYLSASDATLRSLGHSPQKNTLPFTLLAVILASSVVGVVGPVFFFGLIIPHAVKLIFRNSPSSSLIQCALLGSISLLIADLFIRGLFNGVEISISIIFAFLSAPVLAMLLKTAKL